MSVLTARNTPIQRTTNTNDSNNVASTSNVSYSQAAQQMAFPKKEQAIVTDAIEGLEIKDYTRAIGNIVGPANIRFVSRISHNRVCLYLSNEAIVEKLLTTHKRIKIGTHELEFRPLKSKNKRVILSNVCPIIPHSVIEDKFKEMHIQIKSQISCIRAGMNEPGYSHILSFRRQVYIDPDDISKLPNVTQINYDSTLYWIYLTTDQVACFLCKQAGHLAKHCKNAETNTQSEINSSQLVPDENSDIIDTTDENNETSITPDVQDAEEMEFKTPVSAGIKRALTSTTSNDESVQSDCSKNVNNANQQDTSTEDRKRKTTKKAKKTDPPPELSTQLEAAKHCFTDENSFPLSRDDLIKFLDEAYGKSDSLNIALKYTRDIQSLIEMLKMIHQSIVHTNLKNRIDRMIKKLENPKKEQATSEDATSSEE